MSVVGIDFGNANLVVALARRGGVDVLENSVGSRQTPCAVVYPCAYASPDAEGGAGMTATRKRVVGEGVDACIQRCAAATVVNVKRWLGVPAVKHAPDPTEAARSLCFVGDSDPIDDFALNQRLRSVLFGVGVAPSALPGASAGVAASAAASASSSSATSFSASLGPTTPTGETQITPRSAAALLTHRQRPEQVACALLRHVYKMVERHNKAARTEADVAVAVPGWWCERQRRAMLDAAKIAGLPSSTRLVNEHAAVCIAYGYPRSEEFPPEEEEGAAAGDGKKPPAATAARGRVVMFVCMGQTSTTVCIAEFRRESVRVRGLAFDPCYGGRNFDDVLAEFVLQDATKDCSDPEAVRAQLRSSPKQWLRITRACENHIKRVLCAGTPTAHTCIESLVEGENYNAAVTRAQFESMVAPVVAKLEMPVRQALERAQMSPSDIDFVEAVGGAMRMPLLQSKLSQILGGKVVGKTLNLEECTAAGSAFFAAMVSPK